MALFLFLVSSVSQELGMCQTRRYSSDPLPSFLPYFPPSLERQPKRETRSFCLDGWMRLIQVIWVMKFLADPLRPCYIIKVGAPPRSCCCVLLSFIMFLPKKRPTQIWTDDDAAALVFVTSLPPFLWVIKLSGKSPSQKKAIDYFGNIPT